MASEAVGAVCAKCGCDLGGVGAGPCPQCGATERRAEVKVTVGGIFGRLGMAGPLALMWSVLPPLGSIVLFMYLSTVGQWLRGHEHTGVVIYACAFAVLAGVALLPTYASAILGGWAFGFGLGYPAALAGFAGGSMIGYLIGRFAARDRAVQLINEHAKWRVVRRALVGEAADGTGRIGHGFWKTVGVVTLLRLPPNSPFALTNLVMAAVKVSFLPYWIGTLLGMAPRTGAAVYIAATLRQQAAEDVAKQRPWWWIAVGIVLTFVVLGVLGTVAKRAIAKMAREPGDGSAGFGG